MRAISKHLWPSMLAGCIAAASAGPAHADALYDRLGGRTAIARIADTLVARFLVDPRLAADFDNINPDRLRHRMADFLCVVAGGPCAYAGRSMAAAHKGLHVSQARFNAVVEDLETAMDQVGIGYRTQNALLARLAPMARGIVHR